MSEPAVPSASEPSPEILPAEPHPVGAGGTAELLRLAFPLIVTFVSHVVMGVADTLVMGQVGTAEQGGVGLGSALFWSFSSFAAGLLSTVTTFVAQAYGARRHDEVRHSVVVGIGLALPLAAVLIATSFWVPELITLFGTNAEARPHVVVYLRWMLCSTPLFLLNFVLIGFFRGISDTVTPMIVTLLVNVVNITLNIVFVFGHFGLPEMGVRGVALATAISMALSVVLFFGLYFSRTHHAKYNTRARLPFAQIPFRRFLKVGVPIGVSWFLENMAFNIMSLYIAAFDPASTAANTIVFQLCHVSFMPAVGISIAASTLVGKYIGAGRPDLAVRSARRSLVLSVAYMGTMGFVFVLAPSFFIGLFNKDPQVLQLGVLALHLAAAFQIFDAMGVTIDGVFRGAGFTLLPMLIRLGVMWVIFVPSIFLLGHFVFETGIAAGWTAALIGLGLQGTTLLIAFFAYPWWNRGRV
jgi:MATE family multidrug resistance protein